jgi:hypothetical protein
MERAEKAYYIKCLKERYRKSGKERKGEILSEVIEHLSVTRKHAIRLMNSQGVGRPRNAVKCGRPAKYSDPEFIKALKLNWRITGYICSKSLKQAIPDWLPFIELEYGNYQAEIRANLLAISPPTMDRILKPYRALKGKSFTRATGFRDEIPIQENIWDVGIPGFIEADTVAHCGGSMSGEFINSLTVVDIHSLWTEVDAVYGRGSHAVLESLKTIESELPFKIIGYDADNGSEVMNNLLLSYFIKERIEQGREPVQVTRSRPYKKNDNAHVEQRNDSIARRYLGYERLEYQELTKLISFYYRNIVCPLQNHFIPTFKLAEKIRIKSRTKRRYEKPLTPYARIMESDYVTAAYKEKLEIWHKSLNPVKLKMWEKKIRQQIDLANKKLKSGLTLTDKDTATPAEIMIRPIFDMQPLKPKNLYQKAENYISSKSIGLSTY